jgi:hypothetical protein
MSRNDDLSATNEKKRMRGKLYEIGPRHRGGRTPGGNRTSIQSDNLQMEQERQMAVTKSGRLLEALREAHGEDGRPDLMFERRRR